MFNINQILDIFVVDAVQDLDNETAATCSGGVGYLNGPDPDVILYKDPNLQGESIGVNAATGDGIPNIGFNEGGGENGFNDQFSSVKINRGIWVGYTDQNYGGESYRWLPGGHYEFGGSDFDDALTSLRRKV